MGIFFFYNLPMVYEQNGGEGLQLDSAPDVSSGFWYFGARLCPFAHRAWWSAFEKGINEEFKYVHIDLGESKPAWYKESINRLGTVPFVMDDGKAIYESLLVVTYFEEKYPDKGTSLLPACPADKATVRLISTRFEVGAFYGLLKAQDDETKDSMKKKIGETLENFNTDLHAFVPNPSGPYLCGEFSLADIAIMPFIDRFSSTLKHYRDFDLDLQKYDRIHSAFEACKTRDAFKKSSQPPEFYIQVYDSYANP